MATKFITVSIDIMHNKELNQSQKFLLAEIEQLSSLEKGCVGSNEHFAKLIGITKANVSRNLSDLKDKGYISIIIENGSRNHGRSITLIKTTRLVEVAYNPYQNSYNPYQNDISPLSKRQETKENRVINKTINIQKNIVNYFSCELLPYFNDEDFQISWLEFMNIRKKKKTVHSELSMKILFDVLNSNAPTDKLEAIEIVNKSVVSGYPNLYAPNKSYQPTQKYNKFKGEQNFDF